MTYLLGEVFTPDSLPNPNLFHQNSLKRSTNRLAVLLKSKSEKRSGFETGCRFFKIATYRNLDTYNQ